MFLPDHPAGFDLGEVENVVDQAEQVLARTLDLLEIGNDRFLSEIGHVFLKNFAVADDGVERRAQLVAHIGEELRLVLARQLELPALVLDFMEQPRILNRQHRLRGKSFDHIDDILREGAGAFRRTTSIPDDIFPRSSGANSRAR